ncbi:hypothetical protein [Streptomyces guryensis]|uniref:Uncharacterized protein n=1 Tax=Streptomyces guryensis TaxID=2886947 RepID=A0A9Q3VQH4_9ACTN|nr:hypothetical protein [Streptomyces guryensis]MCD9875972.1 hypothetical protein [Streptomyces guryensis]
MTATVAWAPVLREGRGEVAADAERGTRPVQRTTVRSRRRSCSHGSGETKAKPVMEGTNLPTDAEGSGHPRRARYRGGPGFRRARRGVVAAAFARDARRSAFRPDTAAVSETISARPRAGTVTVLEEAERRDVTPRAAPWPRNTSVRR